MPDLGPAIVFGSGEDQPAGSVDYELIDAYLAVELRHLPKGRGLDEEEADFLNLMLVVKDERGKAEAKAAKEAARKH